MGMNCGRFFDISKRKLVDREILSFSIPYKLFKEMEESIAGSFLETEIWHKLRERQ